MIVVLFFASRPALAAPSIMGWNSCRHAQAEAIAIFTRCTLTRTKAPIFSSVSRKVPEVAWARPIRRNARPARSPSRRTRAAVGWRRMVRCRRA